MNREALAWAAGLFEGEGCFVLGRRKHFRNARAVLVSTDKDVLLRFASTLGYGSVLVRRGTGSLGTKKQYQWSTGSFELFQVTVAFLWFGLGLRRRHKASHILKEMFRYHMSLSKYAH